MTLALARGILIKIEFKRHVSQWYILGIFGSTLERGIPHTCGDLYRRQSSRESFAEPGKATTSKMTGREAFNMTRLLSILLVFAFVQDVDGARYLLGSPGVCKHKAAEAWAGRMNDKYILCSMSHWYFPFDEINKCTAEVFTQLDLCEIPASGPVTQDSSYLIWGIALEQTDSSSFPWFTFDIHYDHTMIRKDCDALYGTYYGNPTEDEHVVCTLRWGWMQAPNSDTIDTLVLAEQGTCLAKVSTVGIAMTQLNCARAGGNWEGNPGAHDYISCDFDVCSPPTVDCVPSDGWETVHTCGNPSSAKVTCTYELAVGIEKGEASESTEGGHTEITVSAEVSADIKGMFSTTLSTSVTTGFEWSKSTSSHTTWSSMTTRTISVQVDPGESVSIKQVVGKCGDYRIHTSEYRVVDVD